jgi:glycosyltransferase involved in cell wall biosynthesis
MRVLHVIPAVADRYGGPSRAVLEMCRALEERGVETLIATTDADGAGRLPVPLGRPTRYRDLTVVFFPRRFGEGLKYSGPLARWLDAHVSDFDVAEIHAVFSHACLAAARASRRHGVPYVVRPLGTLDPRGLRRKFVRKRVVWYSSARSMLREAAAVHYTTREERELAETTLGLERGVVIPLGVDASLFEVGPGAFRVRHPELREQPYVLTLSRLDPVKGIELLLDAFGRLPAGTESTRWQLVVAGTGDTDYVQSLRARAARANAPVHFVGWLEAADRVGALREAGLLAAPSIQESFGLAVVEAMACGVPVLVSDQLHLAKDIEDAGAGWVIPLDATAIARALAHALGDASQRVARGRAGRALVRARFEWSGIAAELEGLYARLASRGRWSPGGRRAGSGETDRRGPGPVTASMPSVAVVVLALNEARNLSTCLESVRGWAHEVFVVDSGSTDETVAIARQHGAHVVTHAFESHARQWAWALGTLPLTADWVLALDADQRLTPELREAISRRLACREPGDGGPVGYYVRRRQVFRGRWIRHGGYYPKYLLKLFRRGEAWTDHRDLVDHHFYVKGPTARLEADLVEDNRNEQDIAAWVAKHARYAALQAREELEGASREAPGAWQAWVHGSPDDRTRWLKARWAGLPLYLRPCLYFLYRYVLRLGFLDGTQGFVFHVLQGFWYRLLVDIHLDELRRGGRPER